MTFQSVLSLLSPEEDRSVGRYLTLAMSAEERDALEEKVTGEIACPRVSRAPDNLDADREFRQPHAWLFPFLRRKVRTPAGPGTLLQVFAERVTVVLATELGRCAVFTPREIAPCDRSF
jgi:hypothetical protein